MVRTSIIKQALTIEVRMSHLRNSSLFFEVMLLLLVAKSSRLAPIARFLSTSQITELPALSLSPHLTCMPIKFKILLTLCLTTTCTVRWPCTLKLASPDPCSLTLGKNNVCTLSLHQTIHYLPGLLTALLTTWLMELLSEAASVIFSQWTGWKTLKLTTLSLKPFKLSLTKLWNLLLRHQWWNLETLVSWMSLSLILKVIETSASLKRSWTWFQRDQPHKPIRPHFGTLVTLRWTTSTTKSKRMVALMPTKNLSTSFKAEWKVTACSVTSSLTTLKWTNLLLLPRTSTAWDS